MSNKIHPVGRLDGRVAIVTGAGSRGAGIGNGRAIAILFAREGARVTLVDERGPWADATREAIDAEGGESAVVEADVTDADACRRAVATTVGRWGGLDVLVNNVGIAGPAGSAVDVDLEAWDRGLRVNVTSMVLMARFSVPELARRGGGAIVNMTSVAGLTAGTSLLYATTKGAIVNMTRQMAADHGRQDIRVNAVAPGMVYTPMVAGGMSEETRERRRRSSLLGTEGTGWDVAHAVLYLASDEARWVTGVTLPVDAGFTAGRAGGVPR